MPTSPPSGVRLVAAADAAAALVLAVTLPLLYPLYVAIPLALFLGAALGILRARLLEGRQEGFWLHLAVFVGGSARLAFDWHPFGSLVPLGLILAWAKPENRRWFGVPVPGSDAATDLPETAALACFLAVTELGWIWFREHPLFIGTKLGVLSPLEGRPGAIGLSLALLLVVAGILGKRPWAWLAAPWVLAPVALAVHPLGAGFFLLVPLWARGAVRRGQGLAVPGPAGLAWVLAPALAGLLMVLRVLPVGWCDRHGFPLLLYPLWESPLFAGREPDDSRFARTWQPMRVTCPIDELAVLHADLLERCKTARWSAGAAPPPDCPFDVALRAALGPAAIPPHRFELSEPQGSLKEWACPTCRTFGEAPR